MKFFTVWLSAFGIFYYIVVLTEICINKWIYRISTQRDDFVQIVLVDFRHVAPNDKKTHYPEDFKSQAYQLKYPTPLM